MGGILLHISRIYPAYYAGYIFLYIPHMRAGYIEKYIPCNIYFYINPRKPSKWDIYYIYSTLSWYMQQRTPEIETFFRPQIQYTASTSAFFVLGLRPRMKKCLSFGGILLDIPLKNTVYTLHIFSDNSQNLVFSTSHKKNVQTIF